MQCHAVGRCHPREVWGKIVCDAVRLTVDGNDFVCTLAIEGISCGRGRTLRGENLVADFRVELPQVVVQAGLLAAFRDRLVEWQANPAEFTCELCDASSTDQKWTLSIGRDDDLIYSAGKPACIISYSIGAAMTVGGLSLSISLVFVRAPRAFTSFCAIRQVRRGWLTVGDNLMAAAADSFVDMLDLVWCQRTWAARDAQASTETSFEEGILKADLGGAVDPEAVREHYAGGAYASA